MTDRIRIGAVSYLNTKPLVFGLEESAGFVDLTFDLPSRLAAQLSAGTLDLALIPAVEYFRHESYRIVSDACIACRGPVLSVKLFSRVAPEDIQTLAMDEGSRTSAALVQILLWRQFGIRPTVSALPIGQGLSDASADAVLLIGDRAIHAEGDGFTEVWDLGDTWCRTTEMPFVFAMWVARDLHPELGRVERILEDARDAGLAHLATIAELEGPAVGMDSLECLSYLRDNLHFKLGPWERRGLEAFYDLAARMGLVPANRELRFHDCQTT